jgi:predicted enzyme involved in methoxymalonyl-ACP biosynthesis
MSCRVLKRGMENFTLNTLSEYAASHGFNKIVGEYIPTSKNELVKNHYSGLGFREVAGKWELDIPEFKRFKVYIKSNTNGTERNH